MHCCLTKNFSSTKHVNSSDCSHKKVVLPMQEWWVWCTVAIMHSSQLEPSRLSHVYRLYHQPPTALKTEPLDIMKLIATNTKLFTPTQETTLVIIMTAEISTSSQLLVFTRAKITMLNLVTTQSPPCVSWSSDYDHMMMTLGDGKENPSPLLSLAWNGDVK